MFWYGRVNLFKVTVDRTHTLLGENKNKYCYVKGGRTCTELGNYVIISGKYALPTKPVGRTCISPRFPKKINQIPLAAIGVLAHGSSYV
jgi:hypothetical protein